MKTNKFLQAVSLLLILIIAISCRSSRSTSGGQYPQTTSPQSETSTNTYPVVHSNSGNLPPGQAKKIYGGQSAKAYAPGQRKKSGNQYTLVIVRTPDIVISRHIDGRYYYRNSEGYTYWKGNDDRYYLDEIHLKEIEYDDDQYDDWKYKGQKNNNAREPKGKEQEEKVKENQKTKDTEHIAKVREQKGMGQNQKAKDNGQNGKDQFDQKVKDNDQKGKDQSDQKVKGNQKEKDQSDQKAKDTDQKEKDQTDQKAKDENTQKGKTKSKDKG